MVVKSPHYLWLLFALIPLGFLWYFSFKRGIRDLLAVAGRWRFQSMKDVYLFKTFFSYLLFLLFYISAVLALADFRWGDDLEKETRRGQEIVFLLDISRSMLATDVNPSRLVRAKAAIRSLAGRFEQSRFALVVFKGAGLMLVPLTEDTYALDMFLEHLSPDIMTAPGSDLQQGLETALASFSGEPGRYRAILLFTDGEFHTGNPALAAEKAERAGVPVLVAVLGTEEGVEIRTPGGKIILDEKQKPVISKVKLPPLKKIARQSGGELFQLDDTAEGENRIIAALRNLREGELSLGFRRVKRKHYSTFLLLSVCFLTLGVVMRGMRWKNLL